MLIHSQVKHRVLEQGVKDSSQYFIGYLFSVAYCAEFKEKVMLRF